MLRKIRCSFNVLLKRLLKSSTAASVSIMLEPLIRAFYNIKMYKNLAILLYIFMQRWQTRNIMQKQSLISSKGMAVQSSSTI